MQIFHEIEPLRAFLTAKRQSKISIGLVPTMGALHPGHLFLVKSSKAENQLTVSSIYVNPTQFNNNSDLEKYPRPIQKDIALLEDAGCDVLFSPENREMYARSSTVKFDFGPLDKILEGEFRPGHFSGVALVVSKLFNIIQPDIAYFGQKDFQQFLVISRLVDELKFGIQLRCIPTKREADGLAMSSRNLRLNQQERARATILYRSLSFATQALAAGADWPVIKAEVRKMWDLEPGVKLEYFVVADRENLIPSESVKNPDHSIFLIAGYIGEIRLIDNMIVGYEN